MSTELNFYAFVSAGRTVAVLEAIDRSEAIRRAPLVQHIEKIPSDCKVHKTRGWRRRGCPVFFYGHLCQLEWLDEEISA